MVSRYQLCSAVVINTFLALIEASNTPPCCWGGSWLLGTWAQTELCKYGFDSQGHFYPWNKQTTLLALLLSDKPWLFKFQKMKLTNSIGPIHLFDWSSRYTRPVYIYWESVLFPGTIMKWDYFSQYSDKYSDNKITWQVDYIYTLQTHSL